MASPTFNGSPQLGSRGDLEGRAHGQAALLLVESLMHALLEKGVISTEEFVDTVESAASVEEELANANASSEFSRSLLYPLAAALRKDLGR